MSEKLLLVEVDVAGGVGAGTGCGAGAGEGVTEFMHITIALYFTLLFSQPSLQITLPSESWPAEQSTPPWPEQAPDVAKAAGMKREDMTKNENTLKDFLNI